MRRFTVLTYLAIILIILIKFVCADFIDKSNDNVHLEQTEAPKKYEIFIDLEDNMLYCLENDVLIKQYPIASGTSDNPSPTGIWRIVDKSGWGDGFGGSFMRLSVPWGIYGIHGTMSPHSIGRNASHGCIRMFSDNAAELYDIVPIGTTVVIMNGPINQIPKGNRIIIPGDRGSDVYLIQKRLKELGFYKSALDGIYGDALKYAVFDFQESKKVKPHNDLGRWDLKLMGFGYFE